MNNNKNFKIAITMYWKAKIHNKLHYKQTNLISNHAVGAVFSIINALAKLRAHAKRIKSRISSIFSTR